MSDATADIIADIIALGRSTVVLSSSLLQSADAYRRNPSDLRTLGGTLTEERLRNLIRGLVLHSQAGGQSGGSTSAVIPLYGLYQERFPGLEPSLTAWIVENRVNEYEPFGTTHHYGAKSFAELKELARLYDARRRREREQQQAADQLAAQAASARRASLATQRLGNAVRRGDVKAVKALIARGADVAQVRAMVGSLQALAAANGRDTILAYLRDAGIE